MDGAVCGFQLNPDDLPCQHDAWLDPDNGLCGLHGGQRDVHDGHPICGSKLRKKPGQFCQIRVGLDPETGRCHRLHGGGTPKGAASPNFKHGKFSRVWQNLLPKDVAKDVRRALSDPELLNLEHEAALSDARVAQVARRMKENGGAPSWPSLRAGFDPLAKSIVELFDALPPGFEEIDEKKESVTDAMQSYSDLLARGADNDRAWKEIRTEANHKRKLAQAENRRRADLKLNIAAASAYALIDAFYQIVADHIGNNEKLEAIGRDVAKLLDSSPSEQISPDDKREFPRAV